MTAPDGTTLDYVYMNDGDVGAVSLEGLLLPASGVYTLSVANTHALGQADVRFALTD